MEDLVVILVVEDDQLIQSVVEEALADGGFEVALASSGEQAVQLLDTTNPKAQTNSSADLERPLSQHSIY